MGWDWLFSNGCFLQLPAGITVPFVHGVAKGPSGAAAQDASVVYNCFSRVTRVKAILFREVASILLYRQDVNLVDNVSVLLLRTPPENSARISRKRDVKSCAVRVVEA